MGYDYVCGNSESAESYEWRYSRLPVERIEQKPKQLDSLTSKSVPRPCNQPSYNQEIRRFDYPDLVQATGCFSPEAFLGKGSHGAVFRASLDASSLTVAVKKDLSFSGNEFEILSQIPHHPHLVNLIGFSADPIEPFLLVVEYMANGSLHDLIHSSRESPSWASRTRFALQVAKAVLWLHSLHPPIIHRDIKSSNVLIDRGNNARLGDFGLAMRGSLTGARALSTPPAGTLGYLDPGYLSPADLSPKRDVFSFGILMLEIISGRKAIDVCFSPPSIVDWAVPLIKTAQFVSVFDPRAGPPICALREMANLAVNCVQSCPDMRPEMSEVVEVLMAVNKETKRTQTVWRRLTKSVFPMYKPSSDGIESGRSSSKVSSFPETGKRDDQSVIRCRSIGSGRNSGFTKESNLTKSRSTVLRNGHAKVRDGATQSKENGLLRRLFW